MSAPRGSREFRGNSRGRGQSHPSSRGKPTLLHRGQSSGNIGAGGNILMSEGTGGGRSIADGVQHMSPQYGAPPKSAFGTPVYGAQPSVGHSAYGPAPSVQGPTSAFAPEIQKPAQQMLPEEEELKPALPVDVPFMYLRPQQKLLYPPFQSSPYAVLHAPPQLTDAECKLLPMQQQGYPQFVNATVNHLTMPHELAMQYARGQSSGIPSSTPPLQHRAQQQYYQMVGQQVRNEPKFCVESLSKISPMLKKIICFTPNKKLAALVETNDEDEISIARSDLLEDFMKYDGRSNVPISRCSMPYLRKRQIEYLVVPHSQFPWAPYYCALCDHHISDLFAAADAHLPNHMKEEKRLEERRTLPERLPPLTDAQLSAIEKILVEAAVTECRPDREKSLRDTAIRAIESMKEMCKHSMFNEAQDIQLSLHGSLVSGILTDDSDINISLVVGGENTKYFVDGVFTAMERAPDWLDVKLSEAPTGQARLSAIFNHEKVTIDWQNHEGVRMSQLLSLYNRLHEDVLPLRQIVRKWAEKCDLTTAEKLSSQHAVPPVLLDVMIIHALQQSKRLPCIPEIRKCSGKNIYDNDLEDVMVITSDIRWNLAELFLEFLLYFSKGDIKHFLIQITSAAKILKTDTKFNKKHLNVIDPIRDRPIASLHKAFQCYFINCFLTSYVHFRIPRIRDVNGILPKALVNVDVYQTASQSPLKKKLSKGGKKEDHKEEVEENESPVSTSNHQQVEISEKELEAIDSLTSYIKPIFIHGKKLEDMLPADFEIDGDQIYSRREMIRIKECRECRINKEIWEELRNEGLNTLYLAPDSDGETSVTNPQGTSSSSTSSKKKRKSKGKKEKQLKVDGECEVIHAREDTRDLKREEELVPQTNIADLCKLSQEALSIGRCASVAINNTAASCDQASTSSAILSTPASFASPKAARRVLKLIKLDSAESSELSCEPSPTDEDQSLDQTGQLTLTSPELTTSSTAYLNNDYKGSSALAVNNMLKKSEAKEVDENEEIVFPESTTNGLQPTFEELHVELKEYDLNDVAASLDKLCENDYDYSFESVSLTAGFKCDQHCSACDSPKHLVTECPQLKVPPIREISRSHWKPHFSGELDRIICLIFDTEKISTIRRKELQEVKNRLREAIQKKLKCDFRLDAFGSSENGFGSNRSDFDVCFRYGENRNERSAEMQINTIINIENALRHARFNRVMSITTAKVPIVKFATRVESGEIDGDISYYNELALHNTQLLKRYCSWTKDDVLSKLGMFIKKWAKNCDIGDASKGSLSSYAYIILMIHFLQRLQPHPLLPVLQEMGEKRLVEVDGWDVYFCDDAPKPSWSQCTLAVGELFLQFLEYFAKFDWHNQVVQIRQTNKLTKIERGWRKLMCIEDPFDLDHNLGSGISPRMFAFIMKSFVTSREVFFTLKERINFVRANLGGAEENSFDIVIADNNISRYGSILFAKCRASIGGAPRDRQCFKCGRIGHFSDACPAVNSGFARRGGGRGGGSMGRDDRGGNKKEEHRYRDARKERLMAQRESYRTAN